MSERGVLKPLAFAVRIETEYLFPSSDAVDVLICTTGTRTAIEVKSRISAGADRASWSFTHTILFSWALKKPPARAQTGAGPA